MLITALEKEREELYTEGRQEGKAVREREIVLAMWKNGADMNFIAKVTGLTMEEIKGIIADAEEDETAG